MNATAGLRWQQAEGGMALALPAVLAAVLFYMDCQAPDRMFSGLPYLLVLVAAQGLAGGRAAMLAAAMSALLVAAAPVVGGTTEPLWMVVVGRGIVVASLAMMVVFLRQRDEARATLREQADAVENTSSRRSDELRLVNAQLHREIAERRRAELRSGYLASIVESSSDAIVGQSLDGLIVSWNMGAERMYGHERASVIGRPTRLLFPLEAEDEMAAVLSRVAAGEKVGEIESMRLRSDGTLFDVAATLSPILDERGAIIGCSMIERDITRRMQAEQALQSLNVELEEKVRQRTTDLEAAVGELEAFSYSVSHDLRAPLRALHGLADTLLEDAAPRLVEDDRAILLRMRSAADRMNGTIEDLLALSRASNNRLEREVVNLAEVARTIIDELRTGHPDRKVDWQLGAGLLAWGDPGLLRLVVQNLLGNAFKYTAPREEAHVSFSVEKRDGTTVTYVVRDDGVGFEADEAERLFRPFTRLDAGGQFEGSGIGLATVARIVERHGGSVSAEGRKGEGAVFRFVLPVPRRERSLDEEEDAIPVAG